ncbi:MAG: outer membrane lipoprotein carrier protein LolA [Myxococcota bacterium]
MRLIALGAVFCFSLLASFGAALSAKADEPKSVKELLAAFREMPGFEARFVEDKHLALLAIPLRSEGRLYFAPPALLLRDVLSPSPQRVLLQGNQVRLSSGPGANGASDPSGVVREQVIDLSARPEIRPLVESVLWLLSGDEAALEGAFEIEFVPSKLEADTLEAESGGDEWILRLIPRDDALAQLLARLVVRGRGMETTEIAVEESSGDRSVMRILEPNPARVFSEAERESIFGTREKAERAAVRNE